MHAFIRERSGPDRSVRPCIGRVAVAVVFTLAASACVGPDREGRGGDGPSASAATDADEGNGAHGEASGEGADDPSSADAGGAPSAPLDGFDGWRDVAVDGATRRVRVHVPDGAPADAPVVVALHGRGAGAEHLLRQSDLVAAADARGFVLALPEARGERWQVTGDDDDVRFIAAAVADLAGLGHTGTGHVHLVGFSQGGSMAMRVAAERPSDVAGLATIASQLPEGVTPTGPVPTLIVYGAQDPLRPVTGLSADEAGEGSHAPDPTVSAAASAEAFASVAGVTSPPAAAALDDGPVVRCRYRGGQVAVVLLLVTDGGHTWPGTSFETPEGRFGPTSQAFDATEVVLDFLLDAGLPGDAGTAAAEAPDPTCGVG